MTYLNYVLLPELWWRWDNGLQIYDSNQAIQQVNGTAHPLTDGHKVMPSDLPLSQTTIKFWHLWISTEKNRT